MTTHTTVRSDLFNNTTGTTIETHDALWTRIVAANGTGYVGITSNKLDTFFGDSTAPHVYRDESSYGADQYSQAVIGGFAGWGDCVGVVVRCNSDTGTGADFYELEVQDLGSGSPGLTIVRKVLNGTATTLDSQYFTWTNGDTVCLEAIGTTLVAYKNGTAIVTITGQTDLTTGKPGLSIKAGAAHTVTLDTWEGGTAAAGSAFSFTGPNISNIAGSNGVAITPVDVSGKTTGSTGSIAHTKSSGGTTWPSWAALNSSTGVISGTPDAVATTTGCKVRYTDSIGNVDSNAFNFTVSAVTRTVSVTLTSDGTTPRASLTGLKWAWWDVVTPDLMTAAPTDKAATGTTNGSGVFTVSLPGSALSAGATGWLTVTNSTGSASQSPSALAFSGPVVVS